MAGVQRRRSARLLARRPPERPRRAPQTSAELDLRCIICHELPRVVVETRCGHLYCRDCMDAQGMAHTNSIRDGGLTMQCAMCRTESHWEMSGALPSGWHHSVCMQRAIDSAIRPCGHAGCPFTGSRSEVAAHARRCEWRPREAPVVITLHQPREETDRVTFAASAIPRVHRMRGGAALDVRFRGIARTWRLGARAHGERVPRRIFMVCPGLAHELRVHRLRQPRTPRPAQLPGWHCVWNGTAGRWTWINTTTNEVRGERPASRVGRG